jgi:hypothetical protein
LYLDASPYKEMADASAIKDMADASAIKDKNIKMYVNMK